MYTPKKLYWEDKLATGDENLDFQHKYLFETFNKLGDAIYADRGKETIDTILGRLRFYAEWHFGKEEDCMERHNCPIAQTNKTAHATFLDLFNKYYDEYKETGGSNDLAIKIHETLSDWFLNHIIGIDTKLHPCIHKK
jgi:hemerythrin-like metal-binding protein